MKNCFIRQHLIITDSKRRNSPDLDDTQTLYKAFLAKRVKRNLESTRQQEVNSEVRCPACDKYQDENRNQHFVNLLAEELAYIQPCLRTRIYVKMLAFLNSVKHCHSGEIELSDTEKS